MARTKSFDPEVVLDLAVEVFRERGYASTSVDDLIARLGIKRQSLYDTFGDKHALFLAALDRYEQRLHAEVVAVLEGDGAGLDAIERVFWAVVEAGEARRPGCLMVNTAVEAAGRDPEASRRVRRNAERVEQAFRAALERALARGDLAGRSRDLGALARYLSNALRGLQVTARMGADVGELRDVIRVTLSVIR